MKKIVRKEYRIDGSLDLKFDLAIIAHKIIVINSWRTNGHSLFLFCEELEIRSAGLVLTSSSPDEQNVTDRHGKHGTHAGGRGNNGGPGINGESGAHAGHIKIWAEEINGPALKINANGADGGNGGNGGDGSNGVDLHNSYGGTCSYHENCSDFYRGGSGGDSGLPGKGADGSNGGNIFIRTLVSSPINESHILNLAGKKGKNGLVGKAGNGGRGQKYTVLATRQIEP